MSKALEAAAREIYEADPIRMNARALPWDEALSLAAAHPGTSPFGIAGRVSECSRLARACVTAYLRAVGEDAARMGEIVDAILAANSDEATARAALAALEPKDD